MYGETPSTNSKPQNHMNTLFLPSLIRMAKNWALVNGKIMAVGDEIDVRKIIKFTKSNAVLSKTGKTIELTIKGT